MWKKERYHTVTLLAHLMCLEPQNSLSSN